MRSIVYVRFLFFFAAAASNTLFISRQTLNNMFQTRIALYPSFASLFLDFIHDLVFLCYNTHVLKYRKDAEAYHEIIQTKQDT